MAVCVGGCSVCTGILQDFEHSHIDMYVNSDCVILYVSIGLVRAMFMHFSLHSLFLLCMLNDIVDLCFKHAYLKTLVRFCKCPIYACLHVRKYIYSPVFIRMPLLVLQASSTVCVYTCAYLVFQTNRKHLQYVLLKYIHLLFEFLASTYMPTVCNL